MPTGWPARTNDSSSPSATPSLWRHTTCLHWPVVSKIVPIREHNELRIENHPGDNFKVGRFQLHLVSQNGIRIRSLLNGDVFSESTGWLYGEGKAFDHGVLVTELAIAVDPACTETYLTP